MPLEDRLAIDPVISSMDDNQRAAFYFENRELIETWSSLRADAERAISDRIPELVDCLREDLEALDDLEAVVTLTERYSYPAIHIARQQWDPEDEGSLIRVVLASDRSLLAKGGMPRLFVAVRVSPDHPNYESAKEHLVGLKSTVKPTPKTGWATSAPKWVLYRYLTPPEGNWSVEDLLVTARADLLRLWLESAATIEQILLRNPGAGQAPLG